MAQALTNEQLQTNILAAIKDSQSRLIAMVNEDLLATAQRIDGLEQRLNKRFDRLERAFRAHATDNQRHLPLTTSSN
ncbi:MAG TPA: hypothetical protein VLI05_04800 [Candidatus Saccharimonadia bacterium]|nr:hypothetical protein [Candidatus Saccharimonadia bacterium]